MQTLVDSSVIICGITQPVYSPELSVKAVFSYFCSISNLEEGKQGPVIGLKSRSLMPYCHFELEASDYISSARRNPELRGPGGAPPGTTLDPNTRVIEFDNVGLGVSNVRKFFIVNPTNNRYSFQWSNEDEQNPKKLPDFRCMSTDGVIRSGKKTEVTYHSTYCYFKKNRDFEEN